MGGSSSKTEPAAASGPEGFGVRVRGMPSFIRDPCSPTNASAVLLKMTPALLQNTGAVTSEQAHAKAEQTYDRDELARQAFQQGAEYAAQQLMQQQVAAMPSTPACKLPWDVGGFMSSRPRGRRAWTSHDASPLPPDPPLSPPVPLTTKLLRAPVVPLKG